MFSCSILYDSQVVGGVERKPFSIVTSSQSYVLGGVTFTYAAGTFTTAPFVTITTAIGGYSNKLIISHMITSNTTTSTTVRVNLDNNGFISEAPTGSVTVNISAFGPGTS